MVTQSVIDTLQASDHMLGLGFRVGASGAFCLLFCVCCCCWCKAAHQARRSNDEDEERLDWSSEHVAKALSEDSKCVRLGSGDLGFRFEKKDFQCFKKLVLEDAGEVEFIARFVAGGTSWFDYGFELDGDATEAVAKLREEKAKLEAKSKAKSEEKLDAESEASLEAQFQAIFKDDAEFWEDDEPVLLVKADDGVSPGLFEILKPVRPTKTAQLEVPGRPHCADGRLVHVHKQDKVSAVELAADYLRVGDIVHLQNFVYAKYKEYKKKHIEEGNEATSLCSEDLQGRDTELIALRGELAKDLWITVRTTKSTFAKKLGVYSAFDNARRATAKLSCGAGQCWYSWLILGPKGRAALHFTAAISFLLFGGVVFLPAGQVDTKVLLAAALIVMIGMIVATATICIRQCGLRYFMPRAVRAKQHAEIEMRGLMESVSTINHAIQAMQMTGSTAVHAVQDAGRTTIHAVQDAGRGIGKRFTEMSDVWTGASSHAGEAPHWGA